MRRKHSISTVLGLWIAASCSGCDRSGLLLPADDATTDGVERQDASEVTDLAAAMPDAAPCLIPYCEPMGRGWQTLCRAGFSPPGAYAVPVPCGGDDKGNWCFPDPRSGCENGCGGFCDVNGYRAAAAAICARQTVPTQDCDDVTLTIDGCTVSGFVARSAPDAGPGQGATACNARDSQADMMVYATTCPSARLVGSYIQCNHGTPVGVWAP